MKWPARSSRNSGGGTDSTAISSSHSRPGIDRKQATVSCDAPRGTANRRATPVHLARARRLGLREEPRADQPEAAEKAHPANVRDGAAELGPGRAREHGGEDGADGEKGGERDPELSIARNRQPKEHEPDVRD